MWATSGMGTADRRETDPGGECFRLRSATERLAWRDSGAYDPVVAETLEALQSERAVADAPTYEPVQIEAMLAVSRAVSEARSLRPVLNRIAREAARVVGARTASILLLEGHNRFRLAGSFGLSRGYGKLLASAREPLAPGRGPSGLAVKTGKPAIFEDVEADERFVPWREIARTEGFRATVAVPLRMHRHDVGALNVYRREPGPWDARDIDLLLFFAQHAAGAVRTAQLIDAQARRLAALNRLVHSLREQTHEHANRLHAVHGLLALGEYQAAESFVAKLGTAYHESADDVARRIHNPVLAGLVLAEITSARQRGTQIRLDPDSHFENPPPALGEADLVTVVGNLLQNAREAVASQPAGEREVILRLLDEPDRCVIEVKSHGPLSPAERRRMFRRGYTSKPAHTGLGLSLVSDVVAATGGTIDVRSADGWVTLTVEVPRV
jgi:signal transduction histidine kinase